MHEDGLNDLNIAKSYFTRSHASFLYYLVITQNKQCSSKHGAKHTKQIPMYLKQEREYMQMKKVNSLEIATEQQRDIGMLGRPKNRG